MTALTWQEAKRLFSLLRQERGQTMAEYGIVLAVVTIAAVGVFTALSGGIQGAINSSSGTLKLDFANFTGAPTNLIPSSNTLTMSGGTLLVSGSGSADSSQTFSSTTVDGGLSVITATSVSGKKMDLPLGNIVDAAFIFEHIQHSVQFSFG